MSVMSCSVSVYEWGTFFFSLPPASLEKRPTGGPMFFCSFFVIIIASFILCSLLISGIVQCCIARDHIGQSYWEKSWLCHKKQSEDKTHQSQRETNAQPTAHALKLACTNTKTWPLEYALHKKAHFLIKNTLYTASGQTEFVFYNANTWIWAS